MYCNSKNFPQAGDAGLRVGIFKVVAESLSIIRTCSSYVKL
jgi:hypothetical protein